MSEVEVWCVVLNWKDSVRTERCVRSILGSAICTRVIVVDNESDGELRQSLEAIGDARVSVTDVSRNLGFSGGVNIGLREFLGGSAQYVLVINNDAEAETGMISVLLESLSSCSQLGMVAPAVRDPSGTVISTGGRFSKRLMRTSEDANQTPDFLTWACVLIRRDALMKTGLLSERFFMYWEDVEFAQRLRRNYDIAVVTGTSVIHEISSSHSRAGTQVAAYSAYGLVTLAIELKSPTSYAMAHARVLARAARALFHNDPASTRAILRGASVARAHRGVGSDVFPLTPT